MLICEWWQIIKAPSFENNVFMFVWSFGIGTPYSEELKFHEIIACIFRPQKFYFM